MGPPVGLTGSFSVGSSLSIGLTDSALLMLGKTGMDSMGQYDNLLRHIEVTWLQIKRQARDW